MTLSRLSLLALAFASFTLVACGDKDTGMDDTAEGDTDTDADADTDTDTDTDPNYFEPYLYSWGFEGGVVGGELATLNSSHGELPPVFYFELYEKEYMNGYDDRYACMIMYEAGASAGSNAPDAWFDFEFDLSTPYFTDCDNLDPNVWGSDPYAIFTQNTWEMTVEEMDADLTATFIKAVGDNDKWETEYEPYVFGVQTYLDGSPIHSMQTMWGVAFEVDGGAIGEDLMELSDIAAGTDGYYRMLPFYLWYVQ
jgi:hypothetical protein